MPNVLLKTPALKCTRVLAGPRRTFYEGGDHDARTRARNLSLLVDFQTSLS